MQPHCAITIIKISVHMINPTHWPPYHCVDTAKYTNHHITVWTQQNVYLLHREGFTAPHRERCTASTEKDALPPQTEKGALPPQKRVYCLHKHRRVYCFHKQRRVYCLHKQRRAYCLHKQRRTYRLHREGCTASTHRRWQQKQQTYLLPAPWRCSWPRVTGGWACRTGPGTASPSPESLA